MSNFRCEICGVDCIDSARGYVTGCEHYPVELKSTSVDKGVKFDKGKNRLGLVLGGFSGALQAVGEVGTCGAIKYTDSGWLSVPNGINRYTDAMYRHLMTEASGELTDSETQLLHAAHAAWNALARLELILKDSKE